MISERTIKMEGLLIIYVIVLCGLFLSWLEEFPKYFAQVVFWPIWLIIEIALSTIRWIKDIKI